MWIELKFRNNKERDDEAEDDPKVKIFYGPPTSCEELGKLGYTLNGYYLVKGKDNMNISGRIRAVYCQFKQPTAKHQGKA